MRIASLSYASCRAPGHRGAHGTRGERGAAKRLVALDVSASRRNPAPPVWHISCLRPAPQVGTERQERPRKLPHRVRERERGGLVRLVETREKGGILEKYYRAIAKAISVPGTLLGHMSPDEGLAAANEFLQIISQGFLRTVAAALQRQALEGDDAPAVILSTKEIWVTPDELKELQQDLRGFLHPYP